jgi:hypothetical protein
VFENKVQRGTFGQQITGDWGELHNEGLHNLYTRYSPNIIRVIKSRNFRWAGNVASTEVMRNVYPKI